MLIQVFETYQNILLHSDGNSKPESIRVLLYAKHANRFENETIQVSGLVQNLE